MRTWKRALARVLWIGVPMALLVWAAAFFNPSAVQTADCAGNPVACIRGFNIRRATMLMTGLTGPRGVAWDERNRMVWIADGPRSQPVGYSERSYSVRLETNSVVCLDSPCGAIDMRGIASTPDGKRRWARHDVNRVDGSSVDGSSPEEFPLLPGPTGIFFVSANTLLATGDYPAGKGSLLIVGTDQTAKVLDAQLRSPTGVAYADGKIYVVESPLTETRWLVYRLDGDRWRRSAILGSVKRESGDPPAFEGIAAYQDLVYAAGPDGLYVFKNEILQGKLEMKEGVSGVAVDPGGIVYFASDHRLFKIGGSFLSPSRCPGLPPH